jgi:hypothetical protein
VKLKLLEATPPWEWPPDAGDTFKSCLRDRGVPESDRMMAAELAGETVVIDDEIAGLLLDIAGNAAESDELRAKAAISLGPVLEEMEMDSIDDEVDFPDELRDEPPITQETLARIKSTLRSIYQDESVPKLVRRRVLEASVRAQEDWHADAVRTAYASPDEEWKLTAVFAMYYVPGFEKQILEALTSSNEDIHYQAIRAAGNRELTEAWPHTKSLLQSGRTPKNLLIAAIGASVYINPDEAGPLLDKLCRSKDGEISEAAEEAILEGAAMASDLFGDEEDEEEEDEDEEDEEEDENERGGYIN